MQTLLYKACHEAVEPQVVDMTMSRVASELVLLSFLKIGSTAVVLVGERYDGTRDQRERDRWGSLLPLVAEKDTNSLGG